MENVLMHCPPKNEHTEEVATQSDLATKYWRSRITTFATSLTKSGVTVKIIVFSNCITRDKRASKLCINCASKDLPVSPHNGTQRPQIHLPESSPPGWNFSSEIFYESHVNVLCALRPLRTIFINVFVDCVQTGHLVKTSSCTTNWMIFELILTMAKSPHLHSVWPELDAFVERLGFLQPVSQTETIVVYECSRPQFDKASRCRCLPAKILADVLPTRPLHWHSYKITSWKI